MCNRLTFLVSLLLALVAFATSANASDPYQASNPSPPDGAKSVDPDVVLSWTAGIGIGLRSRHLVYVGRDYDRVLNADTGWPEYQGHTRAFITVWDPGVLEPCKTYFWRIDEYNEDGSVTKGEVWRFTTSCKDVRIKWSQPPIEIDPNADVPTYCGWDQDSWTFQPDVYGRVAADDFRCLGRMPVTSIHWWGSHVGWEYPEPPGEANEPIAWRLGFWSNVPAVPGGDPNYSYPKELLWQIDVDASRVDSEWVGYDEFPGITIWEACFQYYVNLEPNEYFWQGDFDANTIDDVFWLSIAAVYPNDVGYIEYPWGWKTRPWHWMDDAVTFEYYGPLEPGMVLDACDVTPIKDPVFGESYDVTFELDTDANYVKWEQPFTGIRDWPHYEDELSMGQTRTEPVTKWVEYPDLSSYGLDVDATADIDMLRAELLVDDFECTTAGPITEIHIWASWAYDYLPYPDNPNDVMFTLSIHRDHWFGPPFNWGVPQEPASWVRDFFPGEFDGWVYARDVPGYRWWSPGYNLDLPDGTVWQYDFYIDPSEAFVQEGSPDEPVVYWLDVQAMPMDADALLGWRTSWDHWRQDGLWALGWEWSHQGWQELLHPDSGESLDLAFVITTEVKDVNIARVVADDWPCDQNTPITAAVWWGSYIGYRYAVCEGPPIDRPIKPDYFWLTIWDDVPDPNPADPQTYSHPNDIIWEYKAFDYDEVLVGYDKQPHGAPNEPVFRYSVSLPHERWFLQKEPNDIYWFSVVAVYDQSVPNYNWGWTNHEHVYNDDAVEGYLINTDPPEWEWHELYDQTGASEDMSFILFTDPEGYTCWDPLECAGQPSGDSTCNASIDFADLAALKASFFKNKGQPGYNCCADFDHSNNVNFADLAILKASFFTGPYSPSTGNQRCPP